MNFLITPDSVTDQDFADNNLFCEVCVKPLTVPFSLSAQSTWCQSSANCCLINQLATTWNIPINEAENIEDFIQPC